MSFFMIVLMKLHYLASTIKADKRILWISHPLPYSAHFGFFADNQQNAAAFLNVSARRASCQDARDVGSSESRTPDIAVG